MSRSHLEELARIRHTYGMEAAEVYARENRDELQAEFDELVPVMQEVVGIVRQGVVAAANELVVYFQRLAIEFDDLVEREPGVWGDDPD